MNRDMDLSGRPPPQPSSNSHASGDDNDSGVRGVRGGLEQQKLDLLGPAYVLEQTGQQQFSRRRIINAEELRDSITQRRSDEPSEVEHVHARRLFVIQGLPAEYLQVLRDTLDIDPRFVDAHASRRSYRPRIRRRRIQDGGAANSTSSACFEYPELLSSRHVPPNLAGTTKQTPGLDGDDAMGKPPARVISANGDVAVFCRASLWLCPEADVLLLDRPVETRPPSRPENNPYRSSELSRASTIGEVNEFRNDTFPNSNNNQTASFETLLYENLAEEWREEPDRDALRSLIEDIVIHQWNELFEAHSADLTPGAVEATALYWQMQRCLEKNLSSSESYDKSLYASSSPPSSASSDWESLLSRLARLASLSRQLAAPPSVATAAVELPAPNQPPTQPRSAASAAAAAAAYDPLIPQRNNSSSSASSAEKNQHSLDRVSYMGGVLLPLSIVSSILSMSDPFGPGGSMFFVFWAVSVPLVFVTVFVIYADSIRKAEVWIEVAAAGGGGGGGGAGSDVENPEDLGPHEHGYNRTAPYSATVQLPVVEPKAGRVMGMAALGEDYSNHPGVDESFDEPSMMAEKMFRKGSGSRRRWQKQQLGWKGACLTAFQLYRLKKGRPPSWGGNVRRERTD